MKTTPTPFRYDRPGALVRRRGQVSRAGYTLVEILVAVTLALFLMLAVTQIFSGVGDTVNETQATLEMSSNLRSTATRLSHDLDLVTTEMKPPRSLDNNEGYFCYIEGRIGTYDASLPTGSASGGNGRRWQPEDIAIDSETQKPDTTVGDFDDILMLTAKSSAQQPFRGRFGDDVIESNVAEIIWFVRGTTLYRRVLLIVPDEQLQEALASETTAVRTGFGFYNRYDVSVRWEWNDPSSIDPYADAGSLNHLGKLRANSLDDLTRRENRFAHTAEEFDIRTDFPFNPHDDPAGLWDTLRMPTLRECSYLNTSHYWWSWHAGWSLPTKELPASEGNPPQNDLLLAYNNFANATLGSNLTSADLPDPALCDPTNPQRGYLDLWLDPLPWNDDQSANAAVSEETLHDTTVAPTGGEGTPYLGNRIAEDVIMTNVIGFDVKAWDPEVRRYVDLGEEPLPPIQTMISAIQNGQSIDSFFPLRSPGWYSRNNPLHARADANYLPNTYDTWTDAYEYDGLKQDGDGLADEGMNRVDDPVVRADGTPIKPNGDGIIDDMNEWESRPPYLRSLRGIQIKIRTFEPDSLQIRETTIIKEFTQK